MGWLYPPGDLRVLRAHVADLAGGQAKRWAMGKAAHDAGRARTWPVVCDRLLGHYDEAARSVVARSVVARSVVARSVVVRGS